MAYMTTNNYTATQHAHTHIHIRKKCGTEESYGIIFRMIISHYELGSRTVCEEFFIITFSSYSPLSLVEQWHSGGDLIVNTYIISQLPARSLSRS
jgi:hypothetical protein